MMNPLTKLLAALPETKQKKRPPMPAHVRAALAAANRAKTIKLFREAMHGKGEMTMEQIGSYVPAKKDSTSTRSAVSVRHTLQLILEPGGYVRKTKEERLEGGFRKAFFYEWIGE